MAICPDCGSQEDEHQCLGATSRLEKAPAKPPAVDSVSADSAPSEAPMGETPGATSESPGSAVPSPELLSLAIASPELTPHVHPLALLSAPPGAPAAPDLPSLAVSAPELTPIISTAALSEALAVVDEVEATNRSAAISDALEPGTNVGGYIVGEKVGEGGMGTVYVGVHPVIGKRVAIKILSRHLAHDADFIERFTREARSVNQITHHNIVDIFAFGQMPDGCPFLVMEYLPGMTFRERLCSEPALTHQEVFEILDQVSSALDAAHRAGVVHRDLKPDNIIVVEARRPLLVKLLDFGLAKILVGQKPGEKTRSGVHMGTPTYMSPEQCQGHPVLAASDIYSLGVMMFILFTGQRPFRAESDFGVYQGHVTKPPPKPRSIAEMPADLERLILKCLEKEPEDRPASVDEVRNELKKIAGSAEMRPKLWLPVAGVGTEAATSADSSRKKRRRRKPWQIKRWLVAASLVALLSSGLLAARMFLLNQPPVIPTLAVQVVSDPAGAQVTINGAKQALITPSLFDVPRTEHVEVEVELEGYEPAKMEKTLQAGQNQLPFRFALRAIQVAPPPVPEPAPVIIPLPPMPAAPVAPAPASKSRTKQAPKVAAPVPDTPALPAARPVLDAVTLGVTFDAVRLEYARYKRDFGSDLDSEWNEILEQYTFGKEGERLEELHQTLSSFRARMRKQSGR